MVRMDHERRARPAWPRASRGALGLPALPLLLLPLWLAVATPVRASTDAPSPTEQLHPGQIVVAVQHAAVARLEADAAAGATSLGRLAHSLGARGWRPALRGSRRARCDDPPRAGKAAAGPAAAAGALPHLDDVFVFELAEGVDPAEIARALSTHPDVHYAEPDVIYRALAQPLPDVPFVPNDRFVTQDGVHWSQGAFGQDFPDLWGLEHTRTLEGWHAAGADASRLPGEGVVVAVIDSGIDADHPDLAGRLHRNPGEIPDNGLDDDDNGFVDDVFGWDFVDSDATPQDGLGHGTHVAGTLAASADDAFGVAGVAPGVEILALRGLDDRGSGAASALAAAVRYAADAGADVLSNSWGGRLESRLIADAFAYAHALGAVSVAAAGNSNADVALFQPANLDEVIAVAAIDPDGLRASFSNHGLGIDVSAPGVDVLSLNANAGDNTIARARPERIVETDHLRLDGTSMACPHVSGAVAVLVALYPEEGPVALRGRILAGAAPLPNADPKDAGRLGAGALSLSGAVEVAPRPVFRLRAARFEGLRPGAVARVVVEVANLWESAGGVTASLSSPSPGVRVTSGQADLGDLDPGSHADNGVTPFELEIDPGVAFGSSLTFELHVEDDRGRSDLLGLSSTVTFFENLGDASGLPLSDFVPLHAALEDYDGDGLPDARLVGFGPVLLFRNQGELRFELSSFDVGLLYPGFGAVDIVQFDREGDGDADLLVSGIVDEPATRLFEQQSDGRFQDVTQESGLEFLRSSTAAVFDWDGDGRLDVMGGDRQSFVAGQTRRPAGLHLMRAEGAGYVDMAERACLPTRESITGGQVLAFDYDDDGDQDLVMGGPRMAMRLLRAEPDGRFVDRTRESGLLPYTQSEVACRLHGRFGNGRRCNPDRVTGFATGDYDNDGDLDLFVTGRRPGVSPRKNALYRNEGDGTFLDVTEISGDLSTSDIEGMPSGNEFFDHDNDGDLDLVVTDNASAEVPGHALFENRDGRFFYVSDVAFPTHPSGAVLGIGDVDRDGALDLYAPAGALGAARGGLFVNRVGARGHWLAFALEGVTSPRDPFGARVRVTAGGVTRTREVQTSARESLPLHFGLGAAERVERVDVHWPSGIVQRLRDVESDQMVQLREPVHCIEAGGSLCPDVSVRASGLRAPVDLSGRAPHCPTEGRPRTLTGPGTKAQGPPFIRFPPFRPQ
jgi:subtilisin family serine protease